MTAIALDRTTDPIRWWDLVRFVTRPTARSDPYPMYARLRDATPVVHSALGVTLVSGHDEITEALRHPAMSSVESHFDTTIRAGRDGLGLAHELPARLLIRAILTVQRGAPTGEFLAMTKRFIVRMDPPGHTRIRGLASRAFTPRTVDDARPMLRSITDEALDALDVDLRAGRPVDLLERFAYRIPIVAICRLLGVPEEDQARVCDRVPALVSGFDVDGLMSRSTVAEADPAAAEIGDYFRALAAHRRSDPGDDLFSRLVEATADGDRLDDDELVAFAALLFAAGYETTANLIGNGFWHLCQHPDQLDRWRDDPTIRRNGVEELLRWEGPIQMTQRIPLEPVTIGGVDLAPGRQVVLLLAAGNRDPRTHTRPEELDLGRADARPLSFGFGIHHCIGAALARAEAEIALGALVDRYPTLRPTTDAPNWRPSIIFRGLSELPVRLT